MADSVSSRPDDSGEQKIRLLLVDDIPETRENLRKLLFFESDIEVVGAATTGEEGIQMAIELKPDYGEAHYALAFMYAMNDLDVGRQHFRRAMELGIEDEHALGGQFYGGDD